MDENTDGKKKTARSIPANYISILQLQKRWINEKERKQAEEMRQKHQVEEHQRIQEDPNKTKVKGECRWSDRNYRGKNTRKKKPINGEVRCAEKEEADNKAVVSEGGETTGLPERKRRIRKRYNSKKKKSQDVAAVKEVVVDECGLIVPLDYVVSVKNTVRTSREKGEKPTGKESVASAIEKQFQNLSIKREETKNLKERIRSSNRKQPNQRRELPARRVGIPIGDATMVWVKKKQNERAGDGIGDGV